MKGLVILAVFVAGCGSHYYPLDSYDAGPPRTVWMITEIAGGRQCGPHIAFNPPDVANELRATGVRVYDHVERARAVCRACSCSSYSAHHYVQVAAEDEERAKRSGFELASPPPDRR